MFLTELSVFKMSIQFFGKAFLRILNSDIQLDLFFNLWRINSCVILPLLSIISLTKNIPLLIHYKLANLGILMNTQIKLKLKKVYGLDGWTIPTT